MRRQQAVEFFKQITDDLGLDSYVALNVIRREKVVKELLDRPCAPVGVEYAALIGLVKKFDIIKVDLK